MDSRTRALLEPKRQAKSKKQEKSDATKFLEISPSRSSANPTSTTSSPISPTRVVPTYDPRALLNPRRPPPKGASVVDLTESKMSSDPNQARSMIEKLYGVESRSERPAKRVKVDEENENGDTRKPSASSFHRGNGVIGSYMKPNDPYKATANMVDLTNVEDAANDDDLQVVKSVNIANEQEVCFGTIHAHVNADAVPKPSAKSAFATPSQWPLMKVTLHRIPAQDIVIKVQDQTGFDFGRIAQDVGQVLAPVMDHFRKLRTQARLSPRPKKNGEWPHQPTSGTWKIMINVYGRRGDVEKIGRVFGQHNVWFAASTLGAEAGFPIVNPHAMKASVVPQAAPKQRNTLSDNRTVEEMNDTVIKLFDHYTNNTDYSETEPPPTIISPLLPHQRQALTFMLDKEKPRTYGPKDGDNSSLWRRRLRNNGAVSFEEVITGIRQAEEPEQCYGGLLADVMGLGKTLEALSLIAATAKEAKTFGDQPVSRTNVDDEDVEFNSKATLIVTPLSTVKNWEDQIAEHMASNSVKVYVYHGSSRKKDPHDLVDYDIIISTYGTIASECSKKKATISPIARINWFRIVLDEAHTIREGKASQSQAMFNLFAQRRWALTGTPIQNRLEDLGSLCKFIRLYPYDSPARFSQYLIAPAKHSADFMPTIRVVVDSFTLRRQKDRIDLPKRSDLVERLDFSPDERRLHDFFRNITKEKIKDVAKQHRVIGQSAGIQSSQILRSIMTLRLICAHGRELLKEKDLAMFRGQSAADAIDIDGEGPLQINERTAYETVALLAEAGLDNCRSCDKAISPESPRFVDDEEEGVRAYVLPCQDVICPECFDKSTYDSLEADETMSCQYCDTEIYPKYITINRPVNEMLEVLEMQEQAQSYRQGEYIDTHTKTRALLKDIHEMSSQSIELVARGEPPLKCVVFSEFTSHLDLIGRALNDHSYSFVRIDGAMSLSKRKHVMDQLSNDDNVTILLASIKAAGQGLNLTAASRAFIMEPLWNPAAEAQAVDRIYRIGQKRPVIVKRYQMNDSMETRIVQLQEEKQLLADLSMNKGHQALSKKESREAHMKKLLNLFK